jgi:hypothetical protein
MSSRNGDEVWMAVPYFLFIEPFEYRASVGIHSMGESADHLMIYIFPISEGRAIYLKAHAASPICTYFNSTIMHHYFYLYLLGLFCLMKHSSNFCLINLSIKS